MEYNVIRAPGYPLWLSFFRLFFGEWALQMTVICQVVLGLFSIHIFLQWLNERFELEVLSYILIHGFLLSPLVWGYSNYILSEALAYPLWLLCVFNLWKGFEGSRKHALFFSVCLILLVLTRQQYIFMIVIGMFVTIHLFLRKHPLKMIWLCASLLPGLCLYFGERTYHYMKSGHFTKTPFAGLQFAVFPLCSVDSLKNVKISDPDLKPILQNIEAKITNSPHKPWLPVEGNFYSPSYQIFFNYLCWNVISQTVSSHIHLKYSNLSPVEQWKKMDVLTTQLGVGLIQQDPLRYVRNYISLLAPAFGGYYGLITLMGLMMFLGLILLNKENYLIFKTSFLGILMHLGNVGLVCFFEPPDMRYIHTTQIILYVSLIILLDKLLRVFLSTRRMVS